MYSKLTVFGNYNDFIIVFLSKVSNESHSLVRVVRLKIKNMIYHSLDFRWSFCRGFMSSFIHVLIFRINIIASFKSIVVSKLLEVDPDGHLLSPCILFEVFSFHVGDIHCASNISSHTVGLISLLYFHQRYLSLLSVLLVNK